MGAQLTTADLPDSERNPEFGQAAYFRAELERQIWALDCELASLRQEWVKCLKAGHTLKIKRIQREARTSELRRREVADMLLSLSVRFPGPSSS